MCARPTLGGVSYHGQRSDRGIGAGGAGKVLGDAKLESEGKADQAAGKVQNAVGGVKDTLKGE